MGGGLLQLVIKGSQDEFLTGNPTMTFFKKVYKRHTNFSIESVEQVSTGNLNFGHYYAYCKNSLNNKWYNYNDNNVREINEEDLITDSAYCLFYQKR